MINILAISISIDCDQLSGIMLDSLPLSNLWQGFALSRTNI